MEERDITPKALNDLLKDKTLEEALETEPIIEELYLDEVEERLYGEFPPVIKLSKGKLLKECRKCGYVTQVWAHQNWCPNFKCRASPLKVWDIDEYNESQRDDFEYNLNNIPDLLDWPKKRKN